MGIRDRIKLEALRTKIEAGTDALERGDFTEIDDADYESYLERLATQPPKQTR